MRKTITLVFICLFAIFAANAQDQQEWKAKTYITGYANTIAEYTNFNDGNDSTHLGIGLSEAAFLVSYKPLEKLELKGTFVYTHKIRDLQSLLVEAYATYSFSNAFKISAGKYLTPLSPVNQYFYAPLNPAASLPMLVSHHFLLPQSISGFQVSGEFGQDFKLGYNITYGNWMSGGHKRGGILGLQNTEDVAVYLGLDFEPADIQYLLGGTGRIYANYNDIVKFGVNLFDGRKATYPYNDLATGSQSVLNTPATRYSLGFDGHLALGGLKINAEYWTAHHRTTELVNEIKTKRAGYYGEMIYEIGIFSPYLRYDFIEDAAGSIYYGFPDTKLFEVSWPTNAYTGGMAIRPIYEVLVKVEYKYINAQTKYGDEINIPAALQVVFPPEEPLRNLVTEDKYSYFIVSAVLSF